MADWAPAKWRKIHGDFVSSVKLRGVGSDARAILATMIAGCWWDGESDEGRMYLGAGIPMTFAQVFAAAECTPGIGRKAWDRLVALKVVGVVGGCPALLRFRSAQRADSTERTRAFRKRSGNGHGNGPGTFRVTEAEAEAEAEADLPPTPASGGTPHGSSGISSESPAEAEYMGRFALTEPKPSKPKTPSKPRLARTDLPDGLAEHVLSELVRACRELDGPTAGPRHNAEHAAFLDALRKVHAAHQPTPDEWSAVIRERLELSRAGESFGSLTIASLCAPANFERWLAGSRARARGATKPMHSGPAAPSPRPTERRSIIVRRGGDDDGQAGAA